MTDQPSKRVHAEFYKTEAGNEPVRDELKSLGRPIKTLVGEDLAFIEINWRLDRPYVDLLRKAQSNAESSIYEARHKIENEQYRTLFFVYNDRMILVSFFHKKSQKTPKHEKGTIMSKNIHRGSSFDSFLEEEGLLDEIKALAAKRTFVHQLEIQMGKKNKKKNLFRQAFSSPSTAERLFNDHVGISLETMARAAALLGCDLDIKLIPRRKY